MPHYIFDTLGAAQTAINAINTPAGYPSADGKTLTYAVPMAHPTNGRWAVPANAGGIDTEAMRTAGVFTAGAPVELAADWWPAYVPE